MSKKKIKYPAACIIHWVTGPVDVCEKHARGWINVGAALGTHVVATLLEEEAECSNCVNENKGK